MLFSKRKKFDVSDKLLLDIIDNSLEGVIIASGLLPKIVYANHAFEKTFGYTFKELKEFSPIQIYKLIYSADRKKFFHRYSARIQGKDVPTNYEIRGIHKSGEVRWVELSSHRIKYQGKFALQANFLDITHHHKNLQIQKEAYEERTKIIENLGDSIIIFDKELKILVVNKAFEKFTGLHRNTIIGRSVDKLFPEHMELDFQKKMYKWMDQIKLGEKISHREVAFQNKNGLVTANFNVSYVKDKEKNLKYVICSIQNVTEERKNYNLLTDKISLLDSILPAMHYGLLVVDNNSKIVLLNDTFKKLWKIPGNIVKGNDDKKLLAFVLNQLTDPEEFLSRVKYLYTHPTESSKDIISFKDERTFERISHPHIRDKKIVGRVWSFYDMTERINLEKRSRESEERFRGAFEHSGNGMALVAPNGRWLKVNKTLCKMLGYSEEELTSKTYSTVTHPDDIKKTKQLTDDLLSGKYEYGYLEKRYITKSKKIIWVNISVSSIRGDQKQLKYFVTQVQNITAQREALVAREEITKKYEIATNFSGQIFYEYEISTGQIKWFGPIKRVLGYDPKEFEKVNVAGWERLIHPEDRTKAVNALISAEKKIGKYICEYRFKSNKNGYIPLLDEGSYFRDIETSKIRMLGSMRDISILKKAQNEIINKEKIFRQVVTNTPVVTFLIDKSGIFTLSEGLGLNKLGLKPGQVVGQSVYDVYKNYPDIIKDIKRGLRGKTFSAEQKVNENTYSVSYTPLLSENGTVIGLVGVATDISERKTFEETLIREKAEDEALLQAMADGVVAIDNKDKIIYANNASQHLLKRREVDIIGQSYNKILTLVTGSGQKVAKEFRPAYLAGHLYKKIERTLKDDLYYIKSDGKMFPVNITANPIIIGKKMVGVMTVFRDISIEKEVDRMKSEFVSLSSHQLRTPITSINWITELLLEEKANGLSAEQKKMIEDIKFSNNRMISLVNALLNVARLEIGTFMVEPKSINLEKISEEILLEFDKQVKQKKLTIKSFFSPDSKVYKADPRLIEIIFQNLLSNAVKYSKQGGIINIKTNVAKNFLTISVSDKGIGIPREQQSLIFTKLFRADNARIADADGTGLGLYIIKLIVESVSGKIWFQSKEGFGTTFYVSLPKKGMARRIGTKTLI